MEEIKNQDKNDSNLSKETYQPETESDKKEQGKIKKYFSSLPKRYFITAFSGMAQGLFVTLIAGTILAQIAGWIGDNYVGNALGNIAAIAKTLMGAGIGVGIAHALQKNKLLVFSAAVAGFAGAFADKLLPSSTAFALTLGAPGNPIGSYVVTMLVVEVVGLYAGKTKLDILIVPLGTLLLSFCGVFLSFPFIWLIDELGELIAIATNATPFVMGIVISVIALVNMNIDWNVWKVLVLIATYICGCSVIFGLFVLSAGISIYTVENLEFLNIFTNGSKEVAYYPINIYAKWLARFFTFVIPVACFNYLPLSFLTGTGSVPMWLCGVAPLFGMLFMIPCIIFFNLSLKRYKSTGT